MLTFEHSILAKKYASNKLKEKKQMFATGGGAMSTKWESKQYLEDPNTCLYQCKTVTKPPYQ